MNLQEKKQKYDNYLNKIVHLPMLYPDGSTRMTAVTLIKTKIVESINMVLAYFENCKHPVNCDILFDKQDTTFISINSISYLENEKVT